MKKPTSYLLLAVLMGIAYCVVEFTDMYGDSAWFKAFALILAVTYLLMWVSLKRKK